ncbi:MAG: hypothetical protein ACXVB1_04555 [Pseudobdellovibrionaceae bacterium]
MNKYLVSLFLLIFSTAAPALSLRALAVKENKSIDAKAYRKTIRASETQQANVASFLKLQDPAPELRDRPWLYTFALKFQNLQPLGRGKISDLTYNLDSYGTGLMPSLEFGFLVELMENSKVSWASGLSGHVGYMAQRIDLITPNGYQFKNTRLITSLMSAVWKHRMRPSFAPKMNFLLNPEIGFVNYVQSNMESSLANFTQQNNFWGLGLGAEYSFTPKLTLLVQYSYREALSIEKISSLQKDNLEIGTQVTW